MSNIKSRRSNHKAKDEQVLLDKETLSAFEVGVKETSVEQGIFSVLADSAEEAKDIICELAEAGAIFDEDIDDERVTILVPVDIHCQNVYVYTDARDSSAEALAFDENRTPLADATGSTLDGLTFVPPTEGHVVLFARVAVDSGTYEVRAVTFAEAVSRLVARNLESQDDEFVKTVMELGTRSESEDIIKVAAEADLDLVWQLDFDDEFASGEPA